MMKRKPFLVLLVALLGAALSLPAAAHGGRFHHGGFHRGHVGVYLGIPWGWPGWYYPPYYSYPYSPPMVVESPRTYIERDDVAGDAGEPYYWYYCDKPRGYHPYVEKCPGGWKKVVPTPPSD
jgi:hypothetical protein